MLKPRFIPHLFTYYVTENVTEISDKYTMPPMESLRRFLNSETYRMLTDKELTMWDFSPEVIMELWEAEQITGDPRNSVYIRGM